MRESTAEVLAQIARTFLGEVRQGRRPSVEDYERRYPEWAEEIRDHLPGMVNRAEAAAGGPNHDHKGSGPAPATPPSTWPFRLADFCIVRELGRGGMGIVFEAEQESLGRHVAIKILPRQMIHGTRQRVRFLREAKAAARLHHTNIVPVFGLGEHDGQPYYVMQCIDGVGLDRILEELRRLREGRPQGERGADDFCRRDVNRGRVCVTEVARALAPEQLDPTIALDGECVVAPANEGADGLPSLPLEQPPWSDRPLPVLDLLSAPPDARNSELDATAMRRSFWHHVAQVGLQAADALDYAHQQGVLHRDVKPSNLLLDCRGTVWVTDFGLASLCDEQDVTRTGDLVGTLRYMAPERFSGAADARSDVYSLGLTLYELLTLRPAFESQQRPQLIRQVLQEEPVRPRAIDARVPRDLEAIVLKAAAREASHRYASAHELADDLRRFIDNRPIRARRANWAERTMRWCRRNPSMAALAATLWISVVLGLAGVTWAWQDAEAAWVAELRARTEAEGLAREIRQGLVDLKAAKQLVDRGRAFAAAQRWDDAAAAFTAAIDLRKEYADAWQARADLYARLGLWDLAASDLAQEFDIHEPPVTWRWYCRALLCCYLGDGYGYREACARLRGRFLGTVNTIFAGELVRASVLMPDPGADLGQLSTMAEDIVSVEPETAWMRHVLALALYRAGNYPRAIEQCTEVLRRDAVFGCISHPIRAMAMARLGRRDEALAALAEADCAVYQEMEQILGPQGDGSWIVDQGAQGDWPTVRWDWVELQILWREAHLLVHGQPPPPDVRPIVLRARAFAGLRLRREADAEYGKALELAPDNAQIGREAGRNRAYLYAQQREWPKAAEAFRRASASELDDSHLASFAALASLRAGELDAYRQLCQEMFERFHDTQDPKAADHVVWTIVLRPDPPPNHEDLVRLAHVATRSHYGNDLVVAAALYRIGRWEESLRSIEASMRLAAPRTSHWCFLAMAQARLGKIDSARQSLSQAREWIERARHSRISDLAGTGPHWEGWTERIEFPLLLREAESVVQDADRASQSAALLRVPD